jgi:hypothetical protein
MKTFTAFVALFVCSSAIAHGPTITVDRMKCRAAQAYVVKYHEYWLRTADGALPITFVEPLGGNAYCHPKERMQYHWAPALDDNHCYLGMSCVGF